MPQSSSMNDSDLDCRIVVSTEPRALANHRDAFVYTPKSSPLSPAESDDDMPMSPITFGRNEDYERSRLSYIGPPPRPSSSSPSTPVSPQKLSPVSPVIFTQFNLSSPSLVSHPFPVFPTAGTQSLALRLKRPLPPLPKVDTDDSTTTGTGSRQILDPRYRGTRPSPSSSDGRDSDSGVNFSPAGSSQSSATSMSCASSTSLNTMASSDSAGSSAAVEAFPADTKPRVPPLTIPTRSQSHPLPQSKMPPVGQPIISPYISITPASPVPHQQFPPISPPLQPKKRAASTTSILLPTLHDVAAEQPHRQEFGLDPIRTKDLPQEPIRASSPAPSLTPSIASYRGLAQSGKSTLKRIASKTRLFGRRTLSSASEPTWSDEDEDETVLGHSSVSMDDRMLRPGERSGSPSTLCSHGSSGDNKSFDNMSMRSISSASGTPEPRTVRRLEIVEVTLTPEGEVWEPLEVHDVIPRLRELRAPTKMKI